MPFPIVVSDGRYPGETVVRGNATVYEFNPYELGTFDPTVYGFAPVEYIGSNFTSGMLPKNESCIRGFDNAGFIMGTSSTIFNEFFTSLNHTNLPGFVKKAFKGLLKDIGFKNEDIAVYKPNPFYKYHPKTNLNSQKRTLDLVDGGEDGQNIPFHPLIQPQRDVDVIFAVDSSADTKYNWPDGSAIMTTYERSLNKSLANGTAFPPVPGPDTFINLGLNTRPVFFGCNASNLTGSAPLVVYLPNYPYVYFSNVSTFDPAYNYTQRDAIITNGYDVATMANGTLDSNWPTCVGCAILSRSFNRTGTTPPKACAQCFDQYCWHGHTNSSNHPPYTPDIALKNMQLGTAQDGASTIFASVSAIAAAASAALWTMV